MNKVNVKLCATTSRTQIKFTSTLYAEVKESSWYEKQTLFGINFPKVAELRYLEGMGSYPLAPGKPLMGPTGKWPCRCTSAVNALSIAPQALSDKNFEGPTGCPSLSLLNYRKTQFRSDKTVILNALWAKLIPIRLIWSESAWWLLHYSIPRVWQPIFCSMGRPRWACWVSDHDIAQPQA